MKIGLTYTGSDDKHQNYQRWLEGNGTAVHVVKLSETDNNKSDFDDCDGLLLSGGIDINPKWYNGNPVYAGRPEQWNDARDSFEMDLLKTSLANQLPVLGICRGLQLINVLLNGTLVQDLGEQSGAVHRGLPDKLHSVHVEKNTMLYEITGEKNGRVNSAHHQSIGKLGEGLKINSRSDDGTIEGIEWSDIRRKPFLLGVQWHVERMFSFNLQRSPFSENIRKRLLEEIKRSASSKLKHK